jgi:hypothetical protein
MYIHINIPQGMLSYGSGSEYVLGTHSSFSIVVEFHL